MFSKILIFILLTLFVNTFGFANSNKNLATKFQEPPIRFNFLGTTIVLNRYFNTDKTMYLTDNHIPLAAKLVNNIYNTENTNIKIQAGIFLAHILYDLDLKISSLYVLQSILINKSDSHLIPLVFKFIVQIVTDLNNDYIISNFFQYIDRTKLSTDNLTAINYYYGKVLFKDSNFEKAKEFFQGIKPEHHNGKYYFLARYYLATIHYLTDEKRKAIPFLDDIFSTKEKLPLELISQARLLAGRIYSDLNMLPESVLNYEKVPQESLTWDQALQEVAWVYLRMENYAKVVGRTHSLNSPFFSMYYFPDGYIIEALGYLKLCRFGKAKYILDEFEKTYIDYLPKLKKVSGAYTELETHKSLPSRIVKTFARNKYFSSYHEGLQRLRFEKARIDRFNTYSSAKQVFHEPAKKFHDFLNKKFSAQETHHLQLLDQYLQTETKTLEAKLVNLYAKYEFVKYEMFSQAKKYLQSSLIETNKVVFSEKERIASSDNKLYIWKFENEYWKDELPFYDFAGINLCKQ